MVASRPAEVYGSRSMNRTHDEARRRFGLGRRHAEDERDHEYNVNQLLRLARAGYPSSRLRLDDSEVKFRYWADTTAWLDQGDLPYCVGYSGAHWLADGPVHNNVRDKQEEGAHLLYHLAQERDEWAGTDYDGTSVRGLAKVLQKDLGVIDSYWWGYGIADLIDTLLYAGPVIAGTDWYESMFYPTRWGRVTLDDNAPVGGHAYVVNGFNRRTQEFRCKNSWGRNWGNRGRFWISFSDMSLLMQANGEFMLAVETKKLTRHSNWGDFSAQDPEVER